MEIRNPVERTLTHHDHQRLARLLAREPAAAGAEALQDLLDASELVADGDVPPNVVTMNAEVLLQREGSSPCRYTLCYPEEARPAEGRVSVLSPLGTSLLGLQAGQVARWQSDAGRPGAVRVVAVLFQPEAHGKEAA